MTETDIIRKLIRRITAIVIVMVMIATGALADFKASVYTSSMKVYKKPSTSAKLLTTLTNGESFTVKKVSGNWAKISRDGHSGYAQIKHMISEKRAKAYTKKSSVVYKGASSSSEKICKVAAGKKIYIVGVSGSYYLVENSSGSTRGYIAKKNVTKKKPSAPVKKPKLPDGLDSTVDKCYPGMPDSERLEYVIYVAQNQMGKPYSSRPSMPSSFDCALLVWYCFDKAEIDVESSAYRQGYDSRLKKIKSISDLKRGDIVVFNTNATDGDKSDHTGIYIGRGYFIHASSGGGKVMVSSLKKGYYNSTFSWGRRVLG